MASFQSAARSEWVRFHVKLMAGHLPKNDHLPFAVAIEVRHGETTVPQNCTNIGFLKSHWMILRQVGWIELP